MLNKLDSMLIINTIKHTDKIIVYVILMFLLFGSAVLSKELNMMSGKK